MMEKSIRIMVAKDLGREEKIYFGGQTVTRPAAAVTYAYDCLEVIGDDAGSGYENLLELFKNLRRIKENYGRGIELVLFNDKEAGVLVHRLINPVPLNESEMKDLTDALQ